MTMTAAAAKEDLIAVVFGMRFQAKNPYNHSAKEKHVRDMMTDWAARIEAAVDAMTPKKAAKRGK